MIKRLYEVIFQVTETLQNGKETTHKKSVFFPCFDDKGIHYSLERRVERGMDLLQSMQYYRVEYLETKVKNILYIE